MLKWLDGREEWSWSEEEGESAGRRRDVVGRRLIHCYAFMFMILCYCFCMFCVWHMCVTAKRDGICTSTFYLYFLQLQRGLRPVRIWCKRLYMIVAARGVLQRSGTSQHDRNLNALYSASKKMDRM